MKLRAKYQPPSSSHRGASLGSVTTSLGSGAVRLSQPTNTIMSPKPNWHDPLDAALVEYAPVPEDAALDEYAHLGGENTGFTMEDSSSKYPSTSQWVASSSEFYSQTTFTSSNYANEDLTITGSSRSKRVLGKSAPDPAISMYRLQGILKKDLADSNLSLTSEMDRDNSTMSLKDRLHKNKATLRALLSEENNPLYKMKLRTQADLNKSFENDMTRFQQNDIPFSMERTHVDLPIQTGPSPRSPTVRTHRDLTKQTGPNPNPDKNGLLQIQTEPQGHVGMGEKGFGPSDLSGDLKALSIAHGGLTQRSLADWPQRKHFGTKRYISPDSSHDSAVDVETTSLQSSPGSSDTQLTVIPRHNHRMATLRHRHHGKGASLPPSGGNLKKRVGGAVDGHQVSPRDTQLQLPLGGTHSNKADSDVDSGIAQGPVGGWRYPGRIDRDRRDSSSSTENDPELDNLLSDSRIQNGSRFSSLSSQDIRTVHRTRQLDHGASRTKYGPVKADHALQPSSPRHSNREDLSDHNAGLLRPRHSGLSASMQDLTQQKRASPINRVRFEDEVSEGDLPLGHHHRTLSQQELIVGTDGTLHHRRPPGIPSGCRAQKLRTGRKGASTSNLLSPHDDYESYQPYLDTNPSEYEARIHGLPPSGKAEDLKLKIHQLRTRAMTPTEVIHAVASDSRVPVTTNMPVHRATPVIITQNSPSHRDDSQSYLSDSLSSEIDLNNEVAQFNGFNDAWTNALEVQKSKKSRKRDNEFNQDSSDNTDSVHSQRVSRPKRAQSNINSGLYKPHSDGHGRSNSKSRVSDRQGSNTSEVRSPGRYSPITSSHKYEEVKSRASNRQGSSTSEVRRPGRYSPISDHRESPYDEVKSRASDRPSSSNTSDMRGPGRYSPLSHHRGNNYEEVKSRASNRQGSSTSEVRRPGRYSPLSHHRENKYEEGKGFKDRKQQKYNDYEEVHVHRQEDGRNEDQHTYAVPQKPPRSRARKTSNPCVVTTYDDSIHQEDVPPVPERGYRSDLERYKELSDSRTSLSGKVDSFRKAAKNKWSALRRAVSLERVDKESSDEGRFSRIKKSPSLQSLAQKLSFKKKGRARFSEVDTNVASSSRSPRHRLSRPSSAPLGRSRKHSASLTSLAAPVDAPKNFRPIGRLKKVYPDGSQLLELVRPPHGPFGFYIARGTATYGGGIFVSRLSDGLPEHFFAGLLGVGDELLEINGQFVTNLTLDEVYNIMSQYQHLLIKTLPYMARVDT